MARPDDKTLSAEGLPAKDVVLRVGAERVQADADTIAAPAGGEAIGPAKTPGAGAATITATAPAGKEAFLPATKSINKETPTKALWPGARVGEYILEEYLAEGGFGLVYSARHHTTGSPAAVKILHEELASDSRITLRFEREIEVARRLRHPNIVEIYDSGCLHDGRPYFVMELLSGVALDAHVRSKVRLEPLDMLPILEPICFALSVAHQRGIIHRDVKASNVFLSVRDGERRVMLLDFGIAKLLDPEAAGLTSANRIVGTPACMAPEQILGQPVDARTDVYALGGLAYYMLTGEPPFHDANLAILQHMQVSIQPRRPSTVAPVGEAFDDLILRALSKRPYSRPSSVNEFLDELRAAVEGRGTAPKQYERRMVAIHIQVQADLESKKEGDDDLHDDMAKCLPFANRILAPDGFIRTKITGNTILLVKELPAEPEEERPARRNAVSRIMALERQLTTRPTYDDRVEIDICVHVGTVQVADRKLVDGDLLHASTWMPKAPWKGVVISAPVLADLGLATQAIPGIDGFFKVVDGGGQAPFSSS